MACERRTCRRVSSAVLWIWVGWAAIIPSWAQSNDEIQTGSQFNFSTPGARSLGLGGAFLAAADDATAAFANPAGLQQLAKPEASLEARAWTFRSLYVNRGHSPETGLTGNGVDTIDGLEESTQEDPVEGLSYLSMVYPRGRWSFALYRHELANFAASLEMQGPFLGDRTGIDRIRPARSHLSLEIVNYGLAAAYRLTDSWSLGLGVSAFEFDLESRTDRYGVVARTGDPQNDRQTGSFYGPADFKPRNINNTQFQEGSDRAAAGSLGVLWKISGEWSLGAVYREGPDFDFQATFVDGPASPLPGEVDASLGGNGRYHVPDVFGLGVAYRPTDSVLVTFDWDRVQYSDLTRDLVNLLRAFENDPGRFEVDDADEIHLGFEYLGLAAKMPWSLRLGAWNDPDHKVRYVGPNDALLTRFRPGEDEIHVAGGVGLVVRRVQMDLAVDLSDRVDTIALSMVARF